MADGSCSWISFYGLHRNSYFIGFYFFLSRVLPCQYGRLFLINEHENLKEKKEKGGRKDSGRASAVHVGPSSTRDFSTCPVWALWVWTVHPYWCVRPCLRMGQYNVAAIPEPARLPARRHWADRLWERLRLWNAWCRRHKPVLSGSLSALPAGLRWQWEHPNLPLVRVEHSQCLPCSLLVHSS